MRYRSTGCGTAPGLSTSGPSSNSAPPVRQAPGAGSASFARTAAQLLVLAFVYGCTPHHSRIIARFTAESEIRQAERQRFEAMTKQDVAALDTLLDDELDYVHTGGNLESRKQFIDAIRNKTLVYESIVPSEVRVRVYDGLALAMGRSRMQVGNASGVSSFEIRFTEVYVRREGRWLLTAWEATRVSS
jgi:hypothetical protein